MSKLATYSTTNYEFGWIDDYNGEKILFLDEFRSSFKISEILDYPDGQRYVYVIRRCTEKEIVSLRTANAAQAHELQISGRDREELFKQLREKEQEAERYKRSAEILVKLKEFAPDKFEYTQRIAAERKEQKGKSSTPFKNNQWTK